MLVPVFVIASDLLDFVVFDIGVLPLAGVVFKQAFDLAFITASFFRVNSWFHLITGLVYLARIYGAYIGAEYNDCGNGRAPLQRWASAAAAAGSCVSSVFVFVRPLRFILFFLVYKSP